jgi:hypothetical protein
MQIQHSFLVIHGHLVQLLHVSSHAVNASDSPKPLLDTEVMLTRRD